MCSLLEKNIVRKAENRPHRKGSCVLNCHAILAVESRNASFCLVLSRDDLRDIITITGKEIGLV